jgi:FAD/FMN-containing dehydrogenase
MIHPVKRRQFVHVAAQAVVAVGWGQEPQEQVPYYYVPGQRGYETARRPFNAEIRSLPGVIAACKSERQIMTAIERARSEKRSIAIKSGGHSFEGFSLNEGGMVIELSRMAQPILTDEQRMVTGPGITLGDVYDFLLPKGRLLPAGSCSGVGLAGLTLGGGYGFFSRQYGLTCDHLERVRMVDGRGHIVDSAKDTDLLWACRGGGNGHFGVITTMVFRTVKAPVALAAQRFKAGPLTVEQCQKRIRAWFEMAEGLPDPMYSGCVVNGKYITVLLTSTSAVSGPAFKRAGKALSEAGFVAGAATNAPLATAIRRYYGVQKPLPFRNFCGGMAVGYGDYEPALGGVIGEVQRTGLIFQINTLGGAIMREVDGAYPHRQKRFLAEVQAYWESEAAAQQERRVAGAEKVRALLGQHVAAHYANYPNVNFTNWQRAYYGANYERLQELKRRYDPENLFQHAQSVSLPD